MRNAGWPARPDSVALFLAEQPDLSGLRAFAFVTDMKQILQVPSDPEQVWFSHQIDVHADFKGRFGYPPPNPSYIAIAADSDDTKSMFSAQVRTLGFSG